VTASPRTARPECAEPSGGEAAPRPLHQLTGLRLFAALAVYFSHVAAPAGSPDWLRALQKSGYAGVTFFFVLSGFVLALNYFDSLRTPRQVWSYAAARFARVYPLYLVALSWPAVHLWAAGKLPEWHLLQKVLGVQAWNPDLHVAFGMLGPAWSISVELFLYATLPLLVPVVRLLDRHVATLLTAIALVLAGLFVLAWLFDSTGRGDLLPADPASAHRWLYRTPLVRVGDFVLGILAARLFVRIRDRRANARLGGWLVPASIAATFLLAAQPSLVNSAWSWDAMYAVPAVALILGLAMAPESPISRLLSLRGVVFLGEASFAFYLCHIEVTRLVGAGSWENGVTPQTVVLEVVNLLFATAVAIGLHVGVERPARTIVRRLLDPPARVRPARRVPDRPLDDGADIGADAVTAPIPVARPARRPGADLPGPRTGEAPAGRPLVPLG
jgi:peptidoglycan/LPS O-acetylase OafA/YrhL